MQVTVADTNNLANTAISFEKSQSGAAIWKDYSIDFIANSNLTWLQFINKRGGQQAGMYLDDVSVELVSATPAVPEASTWAMMILGFAGIGAMTLRRRSNATRVA